MWRELSDATRATFFWPTPSAPREPTQNFEKEVTAGVAPPNNFEVLKMHPWIVERLRLDPFPHDRRRWIEINHWQEERINP
jgi:hypothetical protein